ncbi:MAG: response regulator transcription factor [Bifidobacteriaceae bacterium]|jgi:DNA-binding NarL/FixJ family response regulator|nr:response regulator transcription factor [Bifidobacteriaceae bacterium]
MNRIKVLLVDDQPLMRMGFAMVLGAEEDLQVVGEAADGRAALVQAAALDPDVVLMDVRMPSMDGIEATRRLVETYPDTKVILLTTFDLDEYAFAGLKAGASGFLLKDVRPAELVDAVRAVAAGDAAVSPRVTRRMLELFAPRLPVAGAADAATGAGEPGGPLAGPDGAHAGTERPAGGLEDLTAKEMATLTPKEREVFGQLALGLTNAQIAAKLYVSEATVKTHVAAVLKKLSLRDRVHVVVYAYETGLLRPGEGNL